MDKDITEKINLAVTQAQQAFEAYKHIPLTNRSAFMHRIAEALESRKANLVKTAARETNLSEKRLAAELARTIFQMKSYADYSRSAEWMDIRIDTGNADRIPAKPDLRKMQVPLGPVAVFGAANFPFAYSTAGGDTACALAAGCTVIVKAHPGHLETGILAAEAIAEAIKACHLPEAVFIHITDTSVQAGETLVKHPLIKAVGFTGSFRGGKQLFDWGNQREVPIPVFAEMSSVNPVFIFPEKLKAATKDIAGMLSASVTLDVGQFCTNPGVMVAIENEALDDFIEVLKLNLQGTPENKMLNAGIEQNYTFAKEKALAQKDTAVIFEKDTAANKEAVTIAVTSATTFIENDILQQEVFGPYSIVVKCKDPDEMNRVALHFKGQLTATVIATEAEVLQNNAIIENIKNLCGRLIMNGVPTGVEVCLAMQHGGPFPATTDSRFTSVGADGIKRFARPQTFQNWPDALLPDELKHGNPLGIWRAVDNKLTK
jgi:alpha-ketoglutaric semialdehyde dehydrogenase